MKVCNHRLSRVQKRAFTLVELLVVIAIIGVLIALLLPAIQAAREAARRSSCTNKIKQWAVAMQSHHDVKKALPAASYNSPNRQGWPPQLWPFIEEKALVSKYNFNFAFYANPNTISQTDGPCARAVPAYYCPSDRGSPAWAGLVDPNPPTPVPRVRGNYALNWGAVGFPIGSVLTFSPLPTARAPFGFTDSLMQNQSLPRRSKFKEFLDGTSKTMVISEKIMHPSDNVLDHRGDILNDDGAALYTTINTPNTSAVDYMKLMTYCTPAPNLPCATATTATGIYHSARSRHLGGVNTGFADASVRFTTDYMDTTLWRAYGTMDGREAF